MAGVIFGCKGRGIGSPRVVPLDSLVEVASGPLVVPDAEVRCVMLESWEDVKEDAAAEDVPDPLDFVKIPLEVGLGALVVVPVEGVEDGISVEDALFCLGCKAYWAVVVDMASA